MPGWQLEELGNSAGDAWGMEGALCLALHADLLGSMVGTAGAPRLLQHWRRQLPCPRWHVGS